MRISILTLALVAGLTNGCSQARPAEVCSAEETLSVVEDILINAPRGTTDLLVQQRMDAIKRAFGFELITFEGQNEQTEAISCTAQITVEGTELSLPVTFSRQPEVGSDNFVYRAAWRNGNDEMMAAMALQALLENATATPPLAPTSGTVQSQAEAVDHNSLVGSREVIYPGGYYEHEALRTGERVPGLPDLSGDYSAVRRRLISAKFSPVFATASSESTYSVCPEEFETGQYFDTCPSPRMALPEVEACAGTGMAPCRLLWRAPNGKTLVIVTMGEPQPGGVSGVTWAD